MNGANQITELLGGPSLEQPLSLEKKTEGSFIDQTIKGLSSNPLFSAGAGLAGIGMAVTLLKRFAVVGSSLLRRRYIVSLQLNNEDPAYSWLLDFVNRHSNRSARMLSGHTSLKIGESGRAAISVASLLVTEITISPTNIDGFIVNELVKSIPCRLMGEELRLRRSHSQR
ncbi:unnamed protein product, partial [Mesorhabditis belari]|uniref:BCS1 N-terminal domain-containing protein n=1 Tax=Mesorhabditis belari TaxID=2138241 RepID=A0AAF3FSV8_9BILA